jgi:hypothetical protein
MKQMVALLAGWLVVLTVTYANAEPYQFTAHYEPRAAGAKAIDVPLTDDVVLPRHSTDYELTAVNVTLKSDDVSLSALANMRDLTFGIRCNGAPCAAPAAAHAVVAEMSSAAKGQTYTLLDPQQIPAAAPTFAIAIDVESHFLSSYLCQNETAMRAKNGKTAPNPATVLTSVTYLDDKGKHVDVDGAGAATTRDASLAEAALRTQLLRKDGVKTYTKWMTGWTKPVPTSSDVRTASALATFSSQSLVDGAGKEIFYSFCSNLGAAVDWDVLAAPLGGAESLATQVAELQAAQHDALASQLSTYLKQQPAFAGMKLVVQRDAPAAPTNLLVATNHAFSLVNDMGVAFAFREVNPSGERDLKGSVDQTASVRLEVLPCGGCNPCASGISWTALVATYITVSLTSTDNKGNPIQKSISLTALGGDRWALQAALTDYLDKDVTLTVSYKNGGNVFTIRTETVHVDNLGLITTFPLVTEVASLIANAQTNSVNPKDSEWQSSIPLSWAFDITAGDGQHVAVTLPWMIGVNTRTAPHFSDVIKFFPHISAVLPVSSTTSTSGTQPTQIVFGAGFAFVDTFTLAWGLSASQAHSYLLIGVSVPDLVKAFE